jgi:hypothetical protein
MNTGENKMNRHFSNEKVQMVTKYTKKCLTALAIKEMQIRISPQVKMAIIKRTKNNKSWREWELGNSHTLLVDM